VLPLKVFPTIYSVND